MTVSIEKLNQVEELIIEYLRAKNTRTFSSTAFKRQYKKIAATQCCSIDDNFLNKAIYHLKELNYLQNKPRSCIYTYMDPEGKMKTKPEKEKYVYHEAERKLVINDVTLDETCRIVERIEQ